MPVVKSRNAVSRLKTLAAELKKVYPRIAEEAAQSLKPIAEAIAEIDETFKPLHYVQSLIEFGPDGAERSPASFAWDVYSDGDEAEYMLCVVRGPDDVCHMNVSVCKYSKHATKANAETDKKGAPHITVKETSLLDPEGISVRLKARLLDALDGFTATYEEHVRAARKELSDLEESEPETTPVTGTDNKVETEAEPEKAIETKDEPPEPSAQPEPQAEEKPESKQEPEREAEPEPKPVPESKPELEPRSKLQPTKGNSAGDAEEPLPETNDATAEMAAAGSTTDIISPDSGIPAQAWIPTSK